MNMKPSESLQKAYSCGGIALKLSPAISQRGPHITVLCFVFLDAFDLTWINFTQTQSDSLTGGGPEEKCLDQESLALAGRILFFMSLFTISNCSFLQCEIHRIFATLRYEVYRYIRYHKYQSLA